MKNLARAAIFLTVLGWGAAAVFGAESGRFSAAGKARKVRRTLTLGRTGKA